MVHSTNPVLTPPAEDAACSHVHGHAPATHRCVAKFPQVLSLQHRHPLKRRIDASPSHFRAGVAARRFS